MRQEGNLQDSISDPELFGMRPEFFLQRRPAVRHGDESSRDPLLFEPCHCPEQSKRSFGLANLAVDSEKWKLARKSAPEGVPKLGVVLFDLVPQSREIELRPLRTEQILRQQE